MTKTSGEDFWRKFWNADQCDAAKVLKEIPHFTKMEEWEVNLMESYFRNAIEYGAGLNNNEEKKKKWK